MFIIFIGINKKRLIQILSVFLTLMIVLSIRLFFLQVYPNEKVTSKYQNHQTETISDCKYMLLDTNGKDLMKYNKKYYLVIDKKPFSLNNYEETLEGLMALNFIMQNENQDFNFSDIMKSNGKTYFNISEETYNKINKLENIKGIYTYIYDEVDRKKAWATSTFLSDIPDEEKIIDGSLDSMINRYIKNNLRPMKDFYLDDSAVYAISKLSMPDENRNIKLTIDKDLEDKIREVLASERFSHLDNIGVSLMESDTGKIRALVQKDESAANINLGIEGSGYEPGSVFKLITLGAALDKGVITLNDTFSCNGEICRGRKHGTISVETAIEKSCNDVFAKIGNKIGYEDVISYAEKTGIFNKVLNLSGEGRNETTGMKPKIEDGMNNISIGQCLTVSPIQILGATNAFVNDGVYVKPYIVESILDKDDNIVETINVDTEKVYSKTTSRLIQNSMRKVVTNGTGINAKVEGIDIGGKTGSATGAEDSTHGWFSGYFKINNKTYTMVVFVPNIQGKGDAGMDLGGGDTAAPIFREIIKSLNEN